MSRVEDTAKIIVKTRPDFDTLHVMLEGLVQHCIDKYATIEQEVKRYTDYKDNLPKKDNNLSNPNKVMAASRRM